MQAVLLGHGHQGSPAALLRRACPMGAAANASSPPIRLAAANRNLHSILQEIICQNVRQHGSEESCEEPA